MSDNIYNIIVPVPLDENRYKVDDLIIEFMNDFKKEYNEIMINRSYSFQPLLNTDGVYQKADFLRKAPFGYIKLKSDDLWLYENHVTRKLVFTPVQCGLYAEKQPFVFWFEYPREGEFIVYRYLGYNLESIIKKTYDRVNNLQYLNYKQEGNNAYVRWVNDINSATKFYYDKIKWNEFSWIKLHDKAKRRKLLSR